MVMDLDTLTEGTFHVWQPNSVDLLKGSPDAEWRIGGYASTEARDRQGEVVLAKGLDFSEFVQFGYYNDNHQQHTAAAVGVPEAAEYHKGKGWYTEGYLLKGVERARQIFDLAKALSDTPRRLGFSIEGKILERFGDKIVKAIIRNVAITNSPVNTECSWQIIAKSWATDLEMKALSVGHAIAPEGGGRVLVPQDLEKDEIKYIYKCPHCAKAFGSTFGLEGHVVKSHQSLPVSAKEYPGVIKRPARSMNKSEAVAFVKHIRPEYSEDVCTRLIDFILDHPED
jgi:uncharacterized C2H2 Zn-finger protein